MEYSMDAFFDWLAGHRENGLLRDGHEGEAFAAQRRGYSIRLAECIGLARLDSLAAAAATADPPAFPSGGPEAAPRIERKGDVERATYSLRYLPGLKGQVHVYSPASEAERRAASMRAIVSCSGHEARHELFHDDGWSAPFQDNAVSLAREGFIVAVPTFAGFLDMAVEKYKEQGELAGCYAVASRLYLYGISLVALRVFQLRRVRDLVVGLYPGAKLGLYGMSGGGETAAYGHALLGGFSAVMVAGYASQYSRSIMAMRHCLCNYATGVLSEVGELSSILALGAPTPLFISSGDSDPIFPIEGVRACYAELGDMYRRAGAEDALRLEVFSGGHEASYAMQRSWFEEGLR